MCPEDDATCAHVREGDASVLPTLALPRISTPSRSFRQQLTLAQQRFTRATASSVSSSPKLVRRQASHLLQPQPSWRCSATKQALEIAKACNALRGTDGATDLDAALAFQAQHPDLNHGAVHGGRGMRIVEAGQDLAKTFERCASEAQMAFGSDALYVEALLDRVRHVEVQILGTGKGQ